MALPFVVCLFLSYLAAVAEVMGTCPVCLPAIVVALAVKSFAPSFAALWLFALGVILDGLGTGPLGLHALTLVALAALLPRCGFTPEPCSTGRWMAAVFGTAWCVALIGAGSDLISTHRGELWEQTVIQQTLTAGITALLVGGLVGGWRQLTGSPCTTH